MRKLFFLFLLAGAGAHRLDAQAAQAAQAADEYAADLQQGAAAGARYAPFSALGSWRGIFALRAGVEVPFNFEVRPGRDGALEVFFRNADESFEGGVLTQRGDSLFVALNQFDNELALAIKDGALEGVLRHQDGRGTPLAVSAIRSASTGAGYRFWLTGVPPSKNISGTYAVNFSSANGKAEQSVGIFRQAGSRLTATFLHVTGDSRYLEGVIEGDSFRLSSFIGSGPSYYIGKVGPDGTISGEVVGIRGSQAFSAVLDAKAALPDAYGLTYLKEGYKTLEFSFPNANGQTISLSDAKYKGKAVIVTIGGTWCPNCIDEAGFLAPWYAANRGRGVEVISIQYERQTDSAFVRKALARMRERFAIQYDQVIGGVADKQVVAASLPALNTFLAFPTTIFIDRQGRVAKIHTGFNGPATGQYYEDFKKEFNEEVDALLR